MTGIEAGKTWSRIGPEVAPTSSSASGVWLLNEVAENQANWPQPPTGFLAYTNFGTFAVQADTYISKGPIRPRGGSDLYFASRTNVAFNGTSNTAAVFGKYVRSGKDAPTSLTYQHAVSWTGTDSSGNNYHSSNMDSMKNLMVDSTNGDLYAVSDIGFYPTKNNGDRGWTLFKWNSSNALQTYWGVNSSSTYRNRLDPVGRGANQAAGTNFYAIGSSPNDNGMSYFQCLATMGYYGSNQWQKAWCFPRFNTIAGLTGTYQLTAISTNIYTSTQATSDGFFEPADSDYHFFCGGWYEGAAPYSGRTSVIVNKIKNSDNSIAWNQYSSIISRPGGSGPGNGTTIDAPPGGATADTSGNCYAAVNCVNTLPNGDSRGIGNIFKFNTSGAVQWQYALRPYNGSATGPALSIRDICLGDDNDLYFTADQTDAVDLTNTTNCATFGRIANINTSSPTLAWATQFYNGTDVSGNKQYAYSRNISHDPTNNQVLITGYAGIVNPPSMGAFTVGADDNGATNGTVTLFGNTATITDVASLIEFLPTTTNTGSSNMNINLETLTRELQYVVAYSPYEVAGGTALSISTPSGANEITVQSGGV